MNLVRIFDEWLRHAVTGGGGGGARSGVCVWGVQASITALGEELIVSTAHQACLGCRAGLAVVSSTLQESRDRQERD